MRSGGNIAKTLTEAKSRGLAHAADDIELLIGAYTSGELGDDDVAPWLKAVCAFGMSLDETTALTRAMAFSGHVISWDGVAGPVVDKHSTGGVGDAVTLAAAPLAAACGVSVAKLSGRALGHTGGTIDKLECIPGLRTTMTLAEFQAQVEAIGCAVAAATLALAPADKKLYALRDRTGTVGSIPLIAASVLSKKIAGGAPAIVLDVKVGRGAFMQTIGDAQRLAETMVAVGARLGRRVHALLTDMDAPLADSIGDALELDEALRLLEGQGSARLREVVLAVAEAMLNAAGVRAEPPYRVRLEQALKDGTGLAKFKAMIAAQGGRLEEFDRTFQAAGRIDARTTGFLRGIDALRIGQAIAERKRGLGGPAAQRVGARVRRHVGEPVNEGDCMLQLFEPGASVVDRQLGAAFDIGPAAPLAKPAVLRQLDFEGRWLS